ncbi:hypothetical protein ACFS5L_19080 [Streptomyces phyllanthi]|uniref:hypothetical protein n=1 Tax=Streptomyces phyllanthi TaxID=1803180 RepID=UPI001884754C|nr:hypothetical protein [Streptomyces phyllanthi]
MIVALGAVTAVVLVATSGGGPSGGKSPAESGRSTASSSTPSLSVPSQLPGELPSLPSDLPSGLPSEFPSDLDSFLPTPAGDEVPYYMLKKGDCFNTSDSRPGQAARRSCSTPHDAEVVRMAELEGTYASDAALKKAASALCEKALERKAVRQPAGTVRGTLVQYPDSAGYELGIDSVACSLSADVGGGDRKLTKPLK